MAVPSSTSTGYTRPRPIRLDAIELLDGASTLVDLELEQLDIASRSDGG